MVVLAASPDSMLFFIYAGSVYFSAARFHPGQKELAPPAQVGLAEVFASRLFVPFRDFLVLHPAIGVFLIFGVVIAGFTL